MAEEKKFLDLNGLAEVVRKTEDKTNEALSVASVASVQSSENKQAIDNLETVVPASASSDNKLATASELGSKLDIVVTMPVTPTNNQTVFYSGETTASYTKGHTYQYQTDTWVDITPQSEVPPAIVSKGTLSFASLPSLASVEVGWMYNISDDFTTTSDFVISGISEKAGSNVYCIEVDVSGELTKKWDVFAVAETIVVDKNYSGTSDNAQSGKAVKQAIDSVRVNVDSTMSDSSTNPVQNKVVKSYIDTQIAAAITQVLNTDF